jgi:DNA-directed RNA polymerase specialized sigma24 family protein
LRRRDRYDEATWDREEEAYYFKENTIWLRKHYQQIHLLKAEIRQLEKEKQQIAEATPAVDWAKIKVKNGDINDPTFWAVQRLLELEARHFWATRTLRALEWARDQLNPEEKRFFNAYIMEAKSISEISRRMGKSWDTVRNRLIKICEKVICRIGPLFGEEV